ncbi:MAG: flagellar hook protein FlgE [Selenomonas montiformis]|nr:flagellar hook protein FlgE [Selenomonas montiformis]
MMRSLFSGVSGLKSHQTRMDVIGNNIANVNTTGFKSSRVTFADTLSQTMTDASAPADTKGGTNPKQVGLGTGVASIDTLFTDGSTQSTGKNTDVALSGNGLFVVKQGNETYYTRDGAFEFDADGNYVLPGSGLYVQGWMASDGVLTTNGSTQNIVIQSGKSMASAATAMVTYENNLNAAALTITNISGGTASAGGSTASSSNPVTLTMSDGTTVTETSGTYKKGSSLPVTTTVTVYDTLGNTHSIPIYFTKSSVDSTNGNTWTVSVNTDGSGTSTISESDGSTTTVKMTDVKLNFTTSGKYNSGSPQTATLTLNNGAAGTQQVTLDLSALTQYSGNSTVKGNADGNAAGTLKSVSIDASGVITGVYTNGVRQSEAQIAVAQFTNAAGLTKTGSSLYQESNNSGTANVKTASDLGVTITPSALEMSNVDIANEFSDMIITQRGFQSNSKIITVGDEMLETLINMKH